MSESIRAQLPATCPNCGYDPSGDDDEFRSGGGWLHDHSITGDGLGTVWQESMTCPLCGEIVARTEQRTDDAGMGR